MSAPQIDPVEGILAVLNEGSATGTNKFGLLLALIDLAPSVGGDPVVPVSCIAEKLIELHWDHGRGYGVGDGPLRQVTSGNRDNTTVVLVVARLHGLLGADLPFELARPKIGDTAWRNAVKQVVQATVKNPLRFLQNLPGRPREFLYEQLPGSPARIRFVDGSLESLIRYGPVLRDLIEFRFVRFVAAANRAVLGTPVEDSIAEHLFGAERHMPPVAMRRDLWLLQQRRCLYTGAAVGDPAEVKSGASVDHVVPWARVRLSTAENFLITSASTNSLKRALPLAPELLGRWVGYLEDQGDEIAAVAAQYGWPSDLRRVASVAAAQYKHARLESPVWCGREGIKVLGENGRAKALTLLNRVGARSKPGKPY